MSFYDNYRTFENTHNFNGGGGEMDQKEVVKPEYEELLEDMAL